jgi:hypothetical protein
MSKWALGPLLVQKRGNLVFETCYDLIPPGFGLVLAAISAFFLCTRFFWSLAYLVFLFIWFIADSSPPGGGVGKVIKFVTVHGRVKVKSNLKFY